MSSASGLRADEIMVLSSAPRGRRGCVIVDAIALVGNRLALPNLQ